MSLGNFRAVFEDVKFTIKANEQLSPDPPQVWIKFNTEPAYGDALTPVVEKADTDGILYNEFTYTWETTGQQLGVYDIKTGDTDLAGNPGETEDTFVLRASYGHWYGYEYGWGL